MAARKNIDRVARENIASWVRYYRRRYPSTDAMAQELGVSQPTISNVLNGRRLPGLDLLICLHDTYKRSSDDYLSWAPEQLEPIQEPTSEPPDNVRPSRAGSPAQSTRPKKTGHPRPNALNVRPPDGK